MKFKVISAFKTKICLSFITRRCTTECQIGGINIPVGLVITVDVLSLHYDSSHFGPVDPNEFYPERFSNESKINPYAYMPFGIGPRMCIGKKFAMLQIKLILAKFLCNYDMCKSLNIPDIEIMEGYPLRKPKNDIEIRFFKRNTQGV